MDRECFPGTMQNDDDLVEAEAQNLRATNGAGAEHSPDLQSR